MHVECGRAVLASTQSSARCAVENATCVDRRRSRDLASMKAKVRLYQKYVSFFLCLHVKS